LQNGSHADPFHVARKSASGLSLASVKLPPTNSFPPATAMALTPPLSSHGAIERRGSRRAAIADVIPDEIPGPRARREDDEEQAERAGREHEEIAHLRNPTPKGWKIQSHFRAIRKR